jgi:predicted AAA+ superfamily ATPase
VLEGNFGQAEFAADLTAVELGRAAPEYQDAAAFFDMTFLTEGMRKVLGLAAQRLAGIGGEPVIGLQTAFGGGKTQTMLALRHLATAPEPTRLAGLADILPERGRRAWRPARSFTLVGTGLGARQRLSRDAEPSLRTPWGLMAWRLAGQTGLDLMAEAESTRSAPGSERLVTVLEAATPCLILLDELVAYARALDADSFEAFLNFIQYAVSSILAVGTSPPP